MKKSIYLAGLVFSASAAAGNYETCILDRMPGAQNDAVAIAVVRLCKEKYPGILNAALQGEGRGWFGYDSGAACAAKKAANTPNNRAARIIFYACNRLYDEP